ncbi:MAG: hypothetical protein ACOCRK_11915 [bacterium]
MRKSVLMNRYANDVVENFEEITNKKLSNMVFKDNNSLEIKARINLNELTKIYPLIDKYITKKYNINIYNNDFIYWLCETILKKVAEIKIKDI